MNLILAERMNLMYLEYLIARVRAECGGLFGE